MTLFLSFSSLLCYIVAWGMGLSPGACLACTVFSPALWSLVYVRAALGGQVGKAEELDPLPARATLFHFAGHTVQQKNKLAPV